MLFNLPSKKLTRLASLISLSVALMLVGIKIWAWLLTGSISMLTSAADGLVDVMASIVTLAGVYYAQRPADKGHRYGHGKAEAVAAFVQALLLAGAGLVLGIESVGRLIHPQPLSQQGLGIWVIVGSTFCAGVLVTMQTFVVKRTGSTAIAADRAHYVTDIAVNIAVLAALVLDGLFGWARSDAAGAFGISCYMLWNARGMVLSALIQLLDQELDVKDRRRIRAAALSCEGVQGVHDIRTRNGGDRVFVELHVEVDGQLTVDVGHEIGDAAEAAVRKLFPAAEVSAHLEPAGIDDERLDNLVK
ncbi:cation diffusion facilitator family transporter [Sodalis ligni]|jgi:ferrous-iron efflux pump FieF|uniref:Cation diffusion facilitator family transporter n=1 Tax=Sodalis ligni TaxID=2697027 RepID=A0A4V2Q2A8_9GAMM|nr:cation diffusion facilitator family transporter [Sodalis ligni]TCL02218.1 cation diffusion facilitator family transporter [Sodalis ligni]